MKNLNKRAAQTVLSHVMKLIDTQQYPIEDKLVKWHDELDPAANPTSKDTQVWWTKLRHTINNVLSSFAQNKGLIPVIYGNSESLSIMFVKKEELTKMDLNLTLAQIEMWSPPDGGTDARDSFLKPGTHRSRKFFFPDKSVLYNLTPVRYEQLRKKYYPEMTRPAAQTVFIEEPVNLEDLKDRLDETFPGKGTLQDKVDEMAFNHLSGGATMGDIGPTHTASTMDLKSPGAKDDNEKVRMELIDMDFPRALEAIGKIATHGAAKYSDGGWLKVSKAEARYQGAMRRHLIKHNRGEIIDPEFGLTHLAHAAWNAMAILELQMRSHEPVDEASEVKKRDFKTEKREGFKVGSRIDRNVNTVINKIPPYDELDAQEKERFRDLGRRLKRKDEWENNKEAGVEK